MGLKMVLVQDPERGSARPRAPPSLVLPAIHTHRISEMLQIQIYLDNHIIQVMGMVRVHIISRRAVERRIYHLRRPVRPVSWRKVTRG